MFSLNVPDLRRQHMTCCGQPSRSFFVRIGRQARKGSHAWQAATGPGIFDWPLGSSLKNFWQRCTSPMTFCSLARSVRLFETHHGHLEVDEMEGLIEYTGYLHAYWVLQITTHFDSPLPAEAEPMVESDSDTEWRALVHQTWGVKGSFGNVEGWFSPISCFLCVGLCSVSGPLSLYTAYTAICMHACIVAVKGQGGQGGSALTESMSQWTSPRAIDLSKKLGGAHKCLEWLRATTSHILAIRSNSQVLLVTHKWATEQKRSLTLCSQDT